MIEEKSHANWNYLSLKLVNAIFCLVQIVKYTNTRAHVQDTVLLSAYAK